jgi:Mce-associated membrane protein
VRLPDRMLGIEVRRGLVAWIVAWTAAAALLAVSGWSYADTRGDGALSYGKARDAVLDAGQRDIARLNTVDGAHADADLGRWLDATTGPLHAQLSRSHSADVNSLKASGTSTLGTVTDAAVTELDTRAGAAKVIATVQVRVTPGSGAATTDRKRFEADLSRTGGDWKLAALTAVPVGAS